MGDFLDWGDDWLSKVIQQDVIQLVTLNWIVAGNMIVEELSGSIVDEAGRTMEGGEVKTQNEFTYFMFETSDLTAKNVPVNRGLHLTWKDGLYQTTSDKGRSFFYDTGFKRRTIIVTKLQQELA